MNRIILIGLVVISSSLFAKDWYNMEDGMALVKESDKHIVIDFYADWCHWCKVMDEKTFADPKVEAYLFEHFIPIRVDTESTETIQFLGKVYTEKELAGAFGVTGLPSLAYLTPNQEVLTVMPGFVEANDFYNLLRYIQSKSYEKQISMEEFLKKSPE